MAEVINDVITLIQTVGFPIVSCIALFWKINDQDKRHMEEMDNLSEVINRNTQALNKLIEELERR